MIDNLITPIGYAKIMVGENGKLIMSVNDGRTFYIFTITDNFEESCKFITFLKAKIEQYGRCNDAEKEE